MTMRIGFVDKSLENYHANVFHGLITNDLKDRGFVVAGCTALDEAGGREWASKNGVAYHAAPERLNEQVDCFMVLAPGDPSVHLELCQRVFLFGKPTYVDKTFAPDLATARRIFELADRHRVSVQTTSALRYTDVQRHVAKLGGGGAGRVRHMVAWGGGRSFAEYAIHPVELVVSCMGPRATRLTRRGTGRESQLLIDFDADRTAVVNVYCQTDTDFAASVTSEKETAHVKVDPDRLFPDATAGILDFLAAGRPNIDRAESLTIRKILDAAEDPRAVGGVVSL